MLINSLNKKTEKKITDKYAPEAIDNT